MDFSKREIITTAWHQTKNNLPLLVITNTVYLMIILSLLQIFTFMLPGLTENLISENSSQIFNMQTPTLQQLLFIIAATLFVTGINLGFLKICINIFKNEQVGTDKELNNKVNQLEEIYTYRNNMKFKTKTNPFDLTRVISGDIKGRKSNLWISCTVFKQL